MLDIFFISSATNTYNTSYNIALYIIVFIVLNFLPITSCNKSHHLWIEIFRHAQIYIIPPLCNGNRCDREIKKYRWCACICHGIFNILSNLPTHLFIIKSHLVYGQHPLKYLRWSKKNKETCNNNEMWFCVISKCHLKLKLTSDKVHFHLLLDKSKITLI